MIEFKKKDKVTAVNVSFRTIVKEYIFWVLGGRPDNHWIGVEEGDDNETR